MPNFNRLKERRRGRFCICDKHNHAFIPGLNTRIKIERVNLIYATIHRPVVRSQQL
jgi:hypothetical protein